MKEKIKQIFGSASFSKALTLFGFLVLIIVVFQIGVLVGFKKAKFSFSMGENYARMFEKKEEKKMRMFADRFPTSHGSAGKIIKIGEDSFVVEDREGIEKTIVFATSTMVKKFKESVSVQEIQAGDFVVVVGSPNEDSEIVAELIRVLPPPLK